MTVATIQEAQSRLPELIRALAPGEELAITENDQLIAKLIVPGAGSPQPIPGRAKGMLQILSEDDEHLQDFAEYMP